MPWSRVTPSHSPTMACSNVSPRHGPKNGTGDGNTRGATAAFTTKMVGWPSFSRSSPPRSSHSPRVPSATHVISSDFRHDLPCMVRTLTNPGLVAMRCESRRLLEGETNLKDRAFAWDRSNLERTVMLLHNPVAEPTAGLDPAERVRFRTLLSSLTSNRIILLSTHIISDVEAVANRLMILQEGRVLTDTTPEALLAHTTGKVWSVTTDQATALQLQASYQVSTMVNQMHGITLRIVSATRPHEAAVVIDPSLEDAYLLATGKQEVRL